MPPVTGDDGTPSGFNPNAPFGVWGDSGSAGPFGPGGNGVVGSSGLSSGVAGFTLANHNRASGVFGSGPVVGVTGYVNGANTAPGGKVAVYGAGSNGKNLGGTGVFGESDTGVGVLGDSNSSDGVLGLTSSGAGVAGVSSNNVGVFGISNGTGVLGWGGSQAGLFIGNVQITGNLSKAGGGFEIDHPLDPANKYLRHSFVESPEMKNVYDGIAVCDAKGEAVVKLPAWLESLNGDFRYQLTAIGKAAPNLFIASPIKGNRFKIGGGSSKLKVSWQVTGVRRDAWAKANRLVAEAKKTGAHRGRYLHPEVHGKGPERSIGHVYHAQAQSHLKRSKKKPK